MSALRSKVRWLDWLWLGLLALYIMAGAGIVPFHGDESTLMAMGRDYHTIFVEGDLSKVAYDKTWATNAGEQELRLLNGTVSKTVYGWLQVMNGFSPRDLNRWWQWNKDYDFNLARGSIPNAELLRQSRLASAAQLALAAVLFFQCVKMTLNRPTAYLASALFALQPNILINGRRAMMEGSHLLGLVLVILAGAWLMRERRWLAYVLLGLFAGFALAAKHPNVIVCALVFLACSSLPLSRLLRCRGQRWRTPATHLAGMAAAGVIALLVFFVRNPAWWSAPLEMPGLIISLREDLLKGQLNWLGGYDSFAEQISGFFQYIFVGERQYFEVAGWANYDAITGQIEAYERSGLAGLLFVGESGRLGLIFLLLAVFGAFDLARNRGVSAEQRLLLLVWILGSALVTLWLTPLPWARYYLPLLPAMIVLVAYALVAIASSLMKNPYVKADGIALLD